MVLLEKELLGNKFVQDRKKEWIKIDSVVLGETSLYTYKTVINSNIGSLLDESLKDPKVVAVVYNWGTGIGYLKNGFNINNEKDSGINKEYTTFIVKDKTNWHNAAFSSEFSKSSPQVTIPSPSKEINYSDFISWNGSEFILKNKRFYPVGPNVYWLGYQESHQYPNRRQIEEVFKVAINMNSTCIRSHTLGVSSGHSKSLLDTNYSDAAWEPIDYTFWMAEQHGIKLIIPLTDNYFYYHGDYSDFCSKRGKSKKDFWWDYDLRNDFKEYIRRWLEHTNRFTNKKIKDDPVLFLIELGNELGNIRNNDDSIPPKEWIEDISKFIKTIDTKHMILDGADECLGKSDNFNIQTIDAFRSNFYHKDYNRMDTHANSSRSKGKPFLVTEYDSKFGDDFLKHIENNKNINGSLWWCLYGTDDNGNFIRHNDGFTQYYKESGSYNNLLRLTNHARRLQGMGEIWELP